MSDKIKKFIGKISTFHQATEVESYNAGFDCGVNGADANNCAIKYFSTQETMHAWEQGKKHAEEIKTNG